MADTGERRYGVKAAARYMGCSDWSVRHYRRNGPLPDKREWTKAELDQAIVDLAARPPKPRRREDARVRASTRETSPPQDEPPGEAQSEQPSSGGKGQPDRDPRDLNLPRRLDPLPDDQAPPPPPAPLESPAAPAAAAPPTPEAPAASSSRGLFDWSR